MGGGNFLRVALEAHIASIGDTLAAPSATRPQLPCPEMKNTKNKAMGLARPRHGLACPCSRLLSLSTYCRRCFQPHCRRALLPTFAATECCHRLLANVLVAAGC